ncbi:hypothetical protein SK128_016308 [Halocaridina rubra]|uniref:Uncharacterized protein n=1 Tax=Halocaridina rubra TaxID=373956 RepID=A0AAN8X1E8_HALRR
MSGRLLGDDVKLECKLRLESHLQEAGPCLACLHPDALKLYTPSPSGLGEGYEVSLDALIGCTRLDGTVARTWIVGAEEDRGHNTLVQHIAHLWCSAQSSVSSYQGLMAFNSEHVSIEGCWEAVKTILSDTLERWGAPDLAEWMEGNRVLIIIEDFDYRKCKEYIKETLEEWECADFLLLTSPSYVTYSAELFAEYLPTLKFTIVDMNMPTILSLAGTVLDSGNKQKFRTWCTENWGIASEILTYPSLIKPLCQAWKSKYISSATKTTTQLLWNILESHIADNMHMELKDIEKWFLTIGSFARMSLEDRNRKHIDRIEVMDKAQDIFPSGFAEQLVTNTIPCGFSLLWYTNIYYPHPVKQFLAAWDAIQQLINGVRLKLLTKYLIDEDSVVIYAAGHLVRILEFQPEYEDKNVSRCAKHLILHMDRAKHRFVYTLRVIQEFLVHPWIIDSFKAEVVLGRHWEIHDKGMLVLPISTLLKFHSPEKIFLLISKKKEAPDLEGVIQLLSQTSIPLALIESSHLEWESPLTTDALVKTVQSGTAQLQDLVGSLSADTIHNLGNQEQTRHLVCLKLRVTELNAVRELFNTPSHLPHLMWLSPDFDLPLVDLKHIQLPEITTPLMDVGFRDIRDDDIPSLCEFLVSIRKGYIAMHLTRCLATPQGVVTLLRQLHRGGLMMTADSKSVNRYRRWRYPALSTIHPGEELAQEKVQHLLGYDERHHYNDNDIRSTALADQDNICALVECLETMESLLCFRYSCSNYLVIKHCNGNVEFKNLM